MSDLFHPNNSLQHSVSQLYLSTCSPQCLYPAVHCLKGNTLPLHSSRLSSALPPQCFPCPSFSCLIPLCQQPFCLPQLSFHHYPLVFFRLLDVRATTFLFLPHDPTVSHPLPTYSSTPSIFHLYCKHTMYFLSGGCVRH